MKLIRVQDAIGCTIAHDMTEIIRGLKKGVLFKKGHIITEEDIPKLLNIGKEHIYVYECLEGYVHENDAAVFLKDLCINNNMSFSDIKEGKIEIKATERGLFIADVEKLRKVNSIGEIMIATRLSGSPVNKGDKLAGMRIIPLVIDQNKLDSAKSIRGDKPLLELKKFRPRSFGVITTGSEVYHKRIEDTFTPVIEEKLSEYGCQMVSHSICNDEQKMISDEIIKMMDSGLELIICTGGMSVDPDDSTPASIKEAGAEIVSYGSPVLPGAMLLVSYFKNKKGIVLGIPGCVMYSKRTVFDLILMRIMADIEITKEYIAGLCNGGLCLGCDDCRWSDCTFGKGY